MAEGELPAAALGRNLDRRTRGVADIALAVLVVAIVATMIVPLPTFLLDVLLTVNLSVAVVLLLVALYVPEALAIASFPTILLVTTLYRLSLDVAATRLILGRADAGDVIRAFGNFVVRGNYVVGGVVFVILTIVQFLVIAKGGERVAEVSARFTLDAMPGKQMAIDAEVRAGSIDQAEARRRRRMLARESSFYGAMDGAMKFVKGDAIAGIVIALVNIAGGLAIGVAQRGMSPGAALQRYGLLTIGEGLVAQIPALIISTAAGILVTRVASEEPDQSLGREIAGQIFAQPRALGIAGVLLAVFGVTPGMPTLPFLVIAVLLLVAARAVSNAKTRRSQGSDLIGAATPRTTGTDRASVTEGEGAQPGLQPTMTPVVVEVGAGLASMVDVAKGREASALRSLIPAMRDQLYQQTGIPFPGVRVRVARTSPTRHVTVSVHEVPAVQFDVPEGKRLVLSGLERMTAAAAAHVTADVDPANGAPAAWLDEREAQRIQREGGSTIGVDEVIVAHLAEALVRHGATFVGIQETQSMLDALEATHPALVRNAVPKPLSLPLLADVLRRLAEERISIRNLRDILEALVGVAALEKDPIVLADVARQALRRQITHAYAPDGRLRAWRLAPEVTDVIRDAVSRGQAGTYVALDPQIAEELRDEVLRRTTGATAIVLADGDVRRFVWVLVSQRAPRVVVLSSGELMPETIVETLGMIGPG